jgi:hypothetical protein
VDFDTEVKAAIYRWIADTTRAPEAGEIAEVLAAPASEVEEAFRKLFAKRVLFLESDGRTIRMAPPFSAVPTQHRVRVGELTSDARSPTRSGESSAGSGWRVRSGTWSPTDSADRAGRESRSLASGRERRGGSLLCSLSLAPMIGMKLDIPSP